MQTHQNLDLVEAMLKQYIGDRDLKVPGKDQQQELARRLHSELLEAIQAALRLPDEYSVVKTRLLAFRDLPEADRKSEPEKILEEIEKLRDRA